MGVQYLPDYVYACGFVTQSQTLISILEFLMLHSALKIYTIIGTNGIAARFFKLKVQIIIHIFL